MEPRRTGPAPYGRAGCPNRNADVNALSFRGQRAFFPAQYGMGMGMGMRTLEVTREFLEKTEELAKAAKVPEMKANLERRARDYRRKLKELERIESDSIAPK
jgi:hypothetical protein